ncbi:hypothetical protein JTE90_004977 [Oedothorax gibbosus]|uniref:Reverse transcriptase RNase H-like domain-containing protein n=1 Tax=Oedothorax gibbosus TaxID=931172 RepID=A0AAV6VJ50_9ARAC|nr:hypothetical protein JTE90_004977 [Oedothorax gibbosus]
MEVSQIEKLDASNYGVWKEDVRVLLMERNCWRITSGEEKYPTEVEPDEKSTPAERSKDLREKAKEIKDFSIRRDKAYTVQAIYRWEDSRFIFDKILEELLAEESRLKQCQKDQSFSAYYVDSPSSNQKQVPSSNKSVTIKPVTKTDEHHPRGRKSRPKGRQPQSEGRRTPSFSRQRDKPPHQTSYVIHALLTESQADKEWATPVVPVVKRDGSIRLCGDYRCTVNKSVKPYTYPLPTVNEVLSTVAGGKVFSKLDLSQAYLQLPVDDATSRLLTLNTHKGLFRVKRLPFGIPGLLNFYGSFLKRRSDILEPLHKLLQKDVPWEWTAEHEEAYKASKGLLTTDDLLVHYDEKLPLILTSDASSYGLGSVLSHLLPNGKEAPVAYYSRTMTKTERNYSQTDKEALAILAGVKKFHSYLLGRRFRIVTDHRPLLGIFNSTKPIPQMISPRVLRWSLSLQAYDYELEYRKGKDIANADALSRLPVSTPEFDVPQPADIFDEKTLRSGAVLDPSRDFEDTYKSDSDLSSENEVQTDPSKITQPIDPVPSTSPPLLQPVRTQDMKRKNSLRILYFFCVFQ